jgi:hypothetical protein
MADFGDSNANANDQELRMAQRRRFKKESIIYGIPVKIPKKNPGSGPSMIMKSELAGTVLGSAVNKDRSFTDRFIIGPDNRINKYFGYILRVMALYSSLTSAYYACFGGPTAQWNITLDMVMEIFFLLGVFRSFFLEYHDEETQKPVRDFRKIAKRYLQADFIFDIIALSSVPLQNYLKDKWTPDQIRVLYFLRVIRGTQFASILQSQVFDSVIKAWFRSNLNASIARNATRQEDSKQDNNKIMHQICFRYFFLVVRLVISIILLSYILGTIWYIVTFSFTESEDQFTFYNSYDLKDMTNNQKLVVVVYFIFTTLSTVGFGDYTPKSEIERLGTIFILLVGVAVFSYIMGQFINILMALQTVQADNEDSENLSKWLGLLAHFNNNKPLPKSMIKQLEVYFEYYWQNDKNYAIQTVEDLRFMDELPNNIRTDIYKDFLFADFLYMFNVHFKMQRESV